MEVEVPVEVVHVQVILGVVQDQVTTVIRHHILDSRVQVRGLTVTLHRHLACQDLVQDLIVITITPHLLLDYLDQAPTIDRLQRQDLTVITIIHRLLQDYLDRVPTTDHLPRQDLVITVIHHLLQGYPDQALTTNQLLILDYGILDLTVLPHHLNFLALEIIGLHIIFQSYQLV